MSENKVCIVIGAGERAWAAGSLPREISLVLSAHGTPLVVVGAEERAIGEVVGEIVYGGGRARHMVADAADAAQVGAAVDKGVSVFGPPRALLVCAPSPVALMPAAYEALSSRAIVCPVLFLPATFLAAPPEEDEVEKRARQVVALLT